MPCKITPSMDNGPCFCGLVIVPHPHACAHHSIACAERLAYEPAKPTMFKKLGGGHVVLNFATATERCCCGKIATVANCDGTGAVGEATVLSDN
jgi:hypothetical protein